MVLWQGDDFFHHQNNAQKNDGLVQGAYTNHDNLCTKKPTVGTLKCNVDANFFVEQNCIGIGMCLRDSQRNLVMEKTCWKEPCL